MGLSNTGRDLMISGVVTGSVATPFSTANTHIGVGDSTAVFAATQTDLQATTNKLRKVVDQAVSLTGNVFVARTTFGTAEANYAWNEWAVFNAATGGTMLNRRVEALGTKTSAQTWVHTVTLTFAAA